MFVRSNMIHSHYTRFSAADNFYVQRSRLNQLLLSFSRSGVRIWNKIPLTLREQRKDPVKRKLHISYRSRFWRLRRCMYVDMSTITTSYPNSLFSWIVFFPYIYRCYLLFIHLFISFYFCFALLTLFYPLYKRQLLHCCPPRIAPLIAGNIDLIYLTIE